MPTLCRPITARGKLTMTGFKRETDKTQFGKDAINEGDGTAHSRVIDDPGKMRDPAKLVERPRSSSKKYTGTIYTKMPLNAATGEFAKAIAAKAEAREALYEKIATESLAANEGIAVQENKAPEEIRRERKLSSEVAKFISDQKQGTEEQKKGIEEHKKPSLIEGLLKYRALAEAPEKPALAEHHVTEQVEHVYPAANNEPSRVDYPDGTTRKFRFDANGELAEIRFEDPSRNYRDSWIRLAQSSQWEQLDGSGKKTGEKFQGTIGLDKLGNVTHTKDGEQKATVESPDGKHWTFYKDGPAILEDRNGRIEEVSYPNETSSLIKYDPSGQLYEIEFPDGVTWQRAGADHWLAIDEKGEPIDPVSHSFFGQIELFRTGSISMTDATGNTAAVNPDGSRTTLYNDGSIVDTSPEGLVSKVVYPSPKESNIEFHYDDDKLIAIDHGNGSLWEKLPGNGWLNKNSGETWNGDVIVNADGSYTAREIGQEARSTENTNGSRMLHMSDGSARVENPDNSSVNVDKSGRIVGIDYPQGQKRQFAYKGNVLAEVRYEDPEIKFKDAWRKEAENWVQYQDGKPTGKSWAGEISVDQSTGEFVYQSSGSDDLAVEKADGSVLTVTDLGVKNIRKAEGDEQNFTRDDDGAIVAFNDREGEWKSSEGSHWFNEDEKQKIGFVHVGDDGTFSFREKDRTRYEFTNGSSMELTANGARRVFDKNDQVIQTIDINRKVYKYGYNDDGNLNKFTGPDGITWNTHNGVRWESADRKSKWHGTANLKQDGELTIFDNDTKQETTHTLDGAKRVHNRNSASPEYGRIFVERDGCTTEEQVIVDCASLEKSADAFFAAADEPSAVERGMHAQLQGKSEAERQVMNEFIERNHGHSMDVEIGHEISVADGKNIPDSVHPKDEIADDLVSAATNDNLSREGNSDQNIDHALLEMPTEEREQYMRGRSIAATMSNVQPLSVDQKSDYDFYSTLRSTLDDAANDETQLRQWEDMIAIKSESGINEAAHDGWLLNQPNPEDLQGQVMEEWSEGPSGIGADFVDKEWDGSGYTSNEAMLCYARAVSQYAQYMKTMPPEEQKAFQESLGASLDLYRQSKTVAGDALVDASMAIATMGPSLITGAVSLGVLGATGVAAGVFKMAAKAALIGQDYDFAQADVLTDFATADVGMVVFLEPGQIGKIFKAAESAVIKASNETTNIGSALLKDGAAEILQIGLVDLMREAMIQGSAEIGQPEMAAIVAKIAQPGTKIAVAQILKQNIDRELIAESKSLLKSLGKQYALELATGAATGSALSFEEGHAQEFSSKLMENPPASHEILHDLLSDTHSSHSSVLDESQDAAQRVASVSSARSHEGSSDPGESDSNGMGADSRDEAGDESPQAERNGASVPPEEVDDSTAAASQGTAHSHNGDEPPPVIDHSDTIADLEPVSNRSDANTEPPQVSDHSDATDEPPQASDQADAIAEPLQVRDHSDNGIEPLQVNDRSNAGDESPQIDNSRHTSAIPSQVIDYRDMNAEPQLGDRSYTEPSLPIGDSDTSIEPQQLDDRRSTITEPPKAHIQQVEDHADAIAEPPPELFAAESNLQTTTVVVEETDTTLPKPDINSFPVTRNISNPFDASKPELQDGTDFGSRMKYEVNGRNYELLRPPSSEFFWDHMPSSRDRVGPVKVHVNGLDHGDLRQLQVILIPVLKDDAQLLALVTQWKTLDPRFTTDGVSPISCAEHLTGPLTAFTLYAKSGTDALKVQERLDKILAQYTELHLHHFGDKNLETILGGTNRVGVVRDQFEVASGSSASDMRVKIDDEVSTRILTDRDLMIRAAYHQRTLTRQLEMEAGLASEILHVDIRGNVTLKLSGQSRDSFAIFEKVLHVSDRTEAPTFGEFRDLSAIYALYRRYGIDPSEANFVQKER